MEQPTILVVDDDPDVREILAESLAALQYRVLTAESAPAALAVLDTTLPDLVLTDVDMGAMSGIELCARLKADPRWELIPVVILTGVSDLAARVAGLAAGADDFFGKPVEPLELRTRVAALLRVKHLLDQLERAENVITSLGLTIEARDPYTAGHCERIRKYAVALGQALGVDQPTLRALGLAGYLHHRERAPVLGQLPRAVRAFVDRIGGVLDIPRAGGHGRGQAPDAQVDPL
jgi:putative two-component system response regulator